MDRTNKSEYFMKEALKEALIAYANDDVPVGCVIVKGDEIVARGHNQKVFLNDPTAHAEILAIRKAAEILKTWHMEDCSIYVSLEPCAMCAGALIQARLKKAYIAVMNDRMGACGSLINLLNQDGFNHKISVEVGLLGKLSSYIISRFFKNLRKKNKGVL
ncbi:tRNA adenosine(34) deaminase TadA [Peptoniphilus sp. GNH]|nr:tRNA adenosine(34) deaminase TadA [Peptoniphilus sp. GNH]